MSAPVFPAEIQASALPSETSCAIFTIEESFLRLTARTGSSVGSMTSFASKIVMRS